MGNQRRGNDRGGQRRKGKFVGIGSLLKADSKYSKGSYLYASVNVYCGKNKAGKPILGKLILKTIENGKPVYYEVKTMKVTEPTENQDSSFVKKNLSVNLLNDAQVIRLKDNGGSSSSAKDESDDDDEDGLGASSSKEQSDDDDSLDGDSESESSDDSESDDGDEAFDF